MTTIQHAHWWVKTYCPHMACPGSDQQTLERMTAPLQTAREMLQLLDDAGLVLWDGYQPKGNRPRNFILLDLEEPMETQNEWLSAENRRLSAQVEQLMRELHAMDGQRERAQQLANSLAAAQEAVLGCDACGLIIDEPQHYSGVLNGVESGHIHLCRECSAGLPLVSVTLGGKPSYLVAQKEWRNDKPPPSKWVMVKAKAIHGGDGNRPHWETECGDCIGPFAFRQWIPIEVPAVPAALAIAGQRALAAWDTTALPKAHDGRMQESMEDFRASMQSGEKQ